MAELRNRDGSTVYLITYSQADIDRFDKQSFGTLIVCVLGKEFHYLKGEYYFKRKLK